ncbi:MAG: alkaline phosphatase D family protein [Ramlibacter sp.]|nr:alkaline phosphatase D family protein [Ramlibacter sp.]
MLRRRHLLGGAAALGALAGCAGLPVQAAAPLRRIGFASCIDQRKPQPIWDTLLAERPDLVIFGGDNAYPDLPYSLARLRQAYAAAAEPGGMSQLRRIVPHLAIWDDHDYGQSDGGAEFPFKAESKAEFLDFWRVPADDPRRGREGLYHGQVFGPPGQRVQVLLLDVRWFRSPLKRTDQRDAPGKERYLPDADPTKTMLGEAQWRWLEAQLREPAEVRLIVSGIQVVVEGHGWERWGNLPRERERLYRLLAQTGAQGVVFLSGDRHIGALYRETNAVPYPIYEMTSSGITHPWGQAAEAGANRLGELFTGLHYGMVEIDWPARVLRLAIKDIRGSVQRSRPIAFNELKART